MTPPAIHNPFFHVGFIVPDLDAAMEEFRAALGIEWRPPIDARVPLLGPDGVIDADVYSVYSEGGTPAIELVQSVPGTPLAGNGGVSFHHLGFWTDRLASSSQDLDRHGWPCAATVAGAGRKPSRFTLQHSPYGFYVELFDTATPRHADLLPNPHGERTNDEHHERSAASGWTPDSPQHHPRAPSRADRGPVRLDEHGRSESRG